MGIAKNVILRDKNAFAVIRFPSSCRKLSKWKKIHVKLCRGGNPNRLQLASDDDDHVLMASHSYIDGTISYTEHCVVTEMVEVRYSKKHTYLVFKYQTSDLPTLRNM